MNPVEILPVQGTIILRARGSELLILAQHVQALKKIGQPQEFVTYFNKMALINRPARKLFQAWLRKDKSLWRRIYDTVKTIEEEVDSNEGLENPLEKKAEDQESHGQAPTEEKASTKKTAKKAAAEKKAATKKTEKKAATKKTEKKAATKKTTKKTTKKKSSKS